MILSEKSFCHTTILHSTAATYSHQNMFTKGRNPLGELVENLLKTRVANAGSQLVRLVGCGLKLARVQFQVATFYCLFKIIFCVVNCFILILLLSC